MTGDAVRESGTLSGVSPRSREKLTPDTRDRLIAARDAVPAAEAALTAAVQAACDESSVRVVADALGVSPTTVQKWKNRA
jgi:transposase-like protein